MLKCKQMKELRDSVIPPIGHKEWFWHLQFSGKPWKAQIVQQYYADILETFLDQNRFNLDGTVVLCYNWRGRSILFDV